MALGAFFLLVQIGVLVIHTWGSREEDVQAARLVRDHHEQIRAHGADLHRLPA